MAQYKQQNRMTLFGPGKAEVYLTDTLNKLESPRVLQRCMAMIASSRHEANRIVELAYKGHITSKESLGFMRRMSTEQNAHHRARNKELDQEFTDWLPELTDEGVEKRRLEVLAMKLAMNIASAAYKGATVTLRKRRAAEISRTARLRSMLESEKVPKGLGLTDSQVDKLHTFLRDK